MSAREHLLLEILALRHQLGILARSDRRFRLCASNCQLVTAFKSGDGGLTLITWRLDSTGSLSDRSTVEANVGPVSEISLAQVRQIGNEHFVAATVRTASRMLTVVFRISSRDVRVVEGARLEIDSARAS
jgi:hypothetical protein